MNALSTPGRNVLRYLDEKDFGERFPDVIGRNLGLDERELQDALRELADKGLARQEPGMWYSLTTTGREWLDAGRQQGNTYYIRGHYATGEARIITTEGGPYIEHGETQGEPGTEAEPEKTAYALRPRARLRMWAVVNGGVLLIAVAALIGLQAAINAPSTAPDTPSPAPTSTLPRRPDNADHQLAANVSLEVREGPALDQKVVAIADPGDLLTVLEDWDAAVLKVGQEGAWIQVRAADEIEGWAAAQDVDFAGSKYLPPLANFFYGRDGEHSFEDDLGPRSFPDWHLMADPGEPVYAGPYGGYVVKVNRCARCTADQPNTLAAESLSDPEWGWGHGNYVVVRYPNRQLPRSTRYALDASGLQGADVFCLYAHLGTINVTESQALPPGAQIGAVGRTGYAMDPHLELEVHAGYSDRAEPHHHLTPTGTNVAVYIGPSPDTKVQMRVNPGDYLMALENWDSVLVKLGHAGQMIKVRTLYRSGWQDGWVDAQDIKFSHMDLWLSLIWFQPDILFES